MTHASSHDRQRTIDLGHEQLMVFDSHAGTRIQVLHGGLWLTEERCLDDRFASAGQWVQLECDGRAVLETIGPTRLLVQERLSGTLAALRQALRRLWPAPAAARALAALLAVALSVGLPEVLSRGFQASPGSPPMAATATTAAQA